MFNIMNISYSTPTQHIQDSSSPSLADFSNLATREALQVILSYNPTTCPLDPIPSTMRLTTVINDSITSSHVPATSKRAELFPS